MLKPILKAKSKPKLNLGDTVNYVGGTAHYNAKSGDITEVVEDKNKYYYYTTFTVPVAGSCAECELKIQGKKSAK